jgi:hypothetical protein
MKLIRAFTKEITMTLSCARGIVSSLVARVLAGSPAIVVATDLQVDMGAPRNYVQGADDRRELDPSANIHPLAVKARGDHARRPQAIRLEDNIRRLELHHEDQVNEMGEQAEMDHCLLNPGPVDGRHWIQRLIAPGFSRRQSWNCGVSSRVSRGLAHRIPGPFPQWLPGSHTM